MSARARIDALTAPTLVSCPLLSAVHDLRLLYWKVEDSGKNAEDEAAHADNKVARRILLRYYRVWVPSNCFPPEFGPPPRLYLLPSTARASVYRCRVVSAWCAHIP